MVAKLLLVFLATFLGVLPALAHASPPDQSWLGGIFDDGDADDVILLVTDFTCAPALPAVTVATPTRHCVHVSLLRSPDVQLAERSPAYRRRAPPLG
jgi:hypothetical protein